MGHRSSFWRCSATASRDVGAARLGCHVSYVRRRAGCRRLGAGGAGDSRQRDGTPRRMVGNELARRFGRRRFIVGTMLGSPAMAGLIGFTAAFPYAVAAALVLVYAALI